MASIENPAEPKPSEVIVKGGDGNLQDRWLLDGLLIIADTAAKIAHLRNETHLRNRRLVGARPWKQVADLTDLTFRLPRRGVKFWAIHLAGGVLKVPYIRPQKLLCIGAGDGKDLAVATLKQNG